MTPCTQTDRIMKLEVNIDRLINIIDDKGSANPGLYQTVILLSNNQIRQGENIDKLIEVVDALRSAGIKTDAEDKVITKLAKERQAYRQWAIALSIASILSIAGLIISLI